MKGSKFTYVCNCFPASDTPVHTDTLHVCKWSRLDTLSGSACGGLQSDASVMVSFIQCSVFFNVSLIFDTISKLC